MTLEAPPRRLVVNADDLGRTEGINQGIFEAHERGLVTSATLMVNYPASADAARQLSRHPRLGVGLHVALTGGVPTSSPEQVPSLVDGEGFLPPKPERLFDLVSGEVLSEVEAQLARFRQLTGRLPTHLDSHHHSHRLRVVCEALIEVARRENLPVRCTSPEVGHRLRQEGVASTDFFDESFFGEATEVSSLERILKALPSGTTELMCHPGRVDQELREGSSYAEPREQELATLTDPTLVRRAQKLGIQLVHFGEL